MATIQLAQKEEVEPTPPPPKKPEKEIPVATVNPDENLEPVTDHQDQAPVSHPSPPEPSPEASQETEPEDITIEDSIAGLSEETPFGSLPIIRSSDKLTSFDAYKAPFGLKSTTKGIISLVMVDYGLSEKLSTQAVNILPDDTTFVLSPYAHNLQSKISVARSKGMEIWMGLPMEGSSISTTAMNIGPHAILSGLQSKENIKRLNTHLGKATGYTGVAITITPAFADGSADLQALITSIATRGLGISQLEPIPPSAPPSVISTAAAMANAPFIQGNIWLDTNTLKDTILKSLMMAEQISLDKGVAIASFHPSALMFSVISEWQKSLETKNIQLAPLTYATKMNAMAQPSPQEPQPATEKHDEKLSNPHP